MSGDGICVSLLREITGISCPQSPPFPGQNVFDPITLAYGALSGIPRRLRRTFRASDSRDLQRSGTLVQHLAVTGDVEEPFAILGS